MALVRGGRGLLLGDDPQDFGGVEVGPEPVQLAQVLREVKTSPESNFATLFQVQTVKYLHTTTNHRKEKDSSKTNCILTCLMTP